MESASSVEAMFVEAASAFCRSDSAAVQGRKRLILGGKVLQDIFFWISCFPLVDFIVMGLN